MRSVGERFALLGLDAPEDRLLECLADEGDSQAPGTRGVDGRYASSGLDAREDRLLEGLEFAGELERKE